MNRLLALVAIGFRTARQDRLRLIATTIVAVLIQVLVLSALSVIAVKNGGGPYGPDLLQQAPLRFGLSVGLSLMVVPLMILIAQTSQLAAPKRELRLANLRLAGATPRDARIVVAAESVLPSWVGSVSGAALFFGLRPWVDQWSSRQGTYHVEVVTVISQFASSSTVETRAGTVRVLPSDVAIPAVWIVLSFLLASLATAFSAWFAMRRVNVTPLGVVRRERSTAPRSGKILLLLVLGLVGFLVFPFLRALLRLPSNTTAVDALLVIIFFGASMIGLILGSATLSVQIGRLMASRGGTASLMAGRRLEADPYAASRALSLLVVAFSVVAAGQAVKNYFAVFVDDRDTFSEGVFRLVDVAYSVALLMAVAGLGLRCLDSILTQHDQFALQIDSGVPRSVIRRSLLLESLAPLGPVLAVAGTLGVVGVRGITGSSYTWYEGAGKSLRVVREPIPIPWGGVVGFGLVVVACAALLTVISFSFAVPRASHRRRQQDYGR